MSKPDHDAIDAALSRLEQARLALSYAGQDGASCAAEAKCNRNLAFHQVVAVMDIIRRLAIVPAGESAAGAARDMREALEKLIQACDKGRRFERGVGGMTIEAQIRRTVINDVSAWAVEEAREALYALPLPAPQPDQRDDLRAE